MAYPSYAVEPNPTYLMNTLPTKEEREAFCDCHPPLHQFCSFVLLSIWRSFILRHQSRFTLQRSVTWMWRTVKWTSSMLNSDLLIVHGCKSWKPFAPCTDMHFNQLRLRVFTWQITCLNRNDYVIYLYTLLFNMTLVQYYLACLKLKPIQN